MIKIFKTDEEKAREAITLIESLAGEPGVDTMMSLQDEYIRIRIAKNNKALFRAKINSDKISEMTHDELSYAIFNNL